jgi:hypothetical protein
MSYAPTIKEHWPELDYGFEVFGVAPRLTVHVYEHDTGIPDERKIAKRKRTARQMATKTASRHHGPRRSLADRLRAHYAKGLVD